MRLNAPTRELISLIRRHRLTYNTLRKTIYTARHHLKLTAPAGARKLPHLIPADALERFYHVIDRAGDIQHQIMLRLLFFTAVRVDELCSIKIQDVDLAEYKIFIDQGKGSKDRYVLFPDGFRLVLQSHMRANPDYTYLFESSRKSRYSERQVQRIVKKYAQEAEVPVHVHPHLFRHQMLSFLTAQGLSDSQIQLISGHASKKSLERYQHLSLEHTAGDYQEAMRKIKI